MQVYEYVAIWLVNWEQPRTQSDFEHSFTFKMFFFQFINFYSPLVYIASIKVEIYTGQFCIAKSLNPGKVFWASWRSWAAGWRQIYFLIWICFWQLWHFWLLLWAFYPADGCHDWQAAHQQHHWVPHSVRRKVCLDDAHAVYACRKVIHMWKVYFYNNTIDTDAEKEINSRWEQDYNLQVRRRKSVSSYLSLTAGLLPDGAFWWVPWDGDPVRVCHNLCVSISIGTFLCIGKQHHRGRLRLSWIETELPHL